MCCKVCHPVTCCSRDPWRRQSCQHQQIQKAVGETVLPRGGQARLCQQHDLGSPAPASGLLPCWGSLSPQRAEALQGKVGANTLSAACTGPSHRAANTWTQLSPGSSELLVHSKGSALATFGFPARRGACSRTWISPLESKKPDASCKWRKA